MPNQNPVKTKDPLESVVFSIPRKYINKKIFVTTKTELLSEGWILHLIHGLNIDGMPQDFDPNPDIERKEIGKAKNLEDVQLYQSTKASRFRDGADGNPSKVLYKLKFEADDEVVDREFSITSTEKNPVTFYTFIKFKITDEE